MVRRFQVTRLIKATGKKKNLIEDLEEEITKLTDKTLRQNLTLGSERNTDKNNKVMAHQIRRLEERLEKLLERCESFLGVWVPSAAGRAEV